MSDPRLDEAVGRVARDAFAYYTECAASPREKADGFRAIARTHAEEKNKGLAKTSYRKTLELQPNDPALLKEAEETPQDTNKPAATAQPESKSPDETPVLQRTTAGSGTRGCSGSAAAGRPGGGG